jgi:glycosyltransferase involved in cell wall biosynthesis
MNSPLTVKRDTRLFFLLSGLGFGGAERVTLNLAYALNRKGFKVVFLLMQPVGEYLDEVQETFEVINLDCDRTYKLPLLLLRKLPQLKPDVLVSTMWTLNVGVSFVSWLFPGIKVIFWEHGIPSKSAARVNSFYPLLAPICYPAAHKIISVSSEVESYVRSRTVGLGKKILRVNNAVQPTYLPNGRHKTSGPPRKIIWVGRLIEEKNPGLMLEAFRCLPNTSQFMLTFVGDGPLRERLMSDVAQQGLDSRVRFLGFRPRPTDLMQKSHIFAFTSNKNYEGLPTVLIEALGCGLRIVTTDFGGGVIDILDNGIYGRVVPVGDAYSFAQAILAVADFPHDPGSQISRAEEFLPDTVANHFISAFD